MSHAARTWQSCAAGIEKGAARDADQPRSMHPPAEISAGQGQNQGTDRASF